jgi:hypothetical protein
VRTTGWEVVELTRKEDSLCFGIVLERRPGTEIQIHTVYSCIAVLHSPAYYRYEAIVLTVWKASLIYYAVLAGAVFIVMLHCMCFLAVLLYRQLIDGRDHFAAWAKPVQRQSGDLENKADVTA